MKRKTTSQLLGEVDPNLKIIPGGVYPHRRRKKAVKLDEVSYVELPTYIPRRMTQDDWNKAGGTKCPRCGNDTVKLVSIGLTGKIKMCPDCLQTRRRLLEHKRRLIDIRHGNARARAGSVTAIS
jgi:hypothetical protein